MVSALIIAPFHDEATGSSSVISRIALDFFRRHNFETYILERHDATREKLAEIIKARTEPFSVVLYYGHGTYDAWSGQLNGHLEPLLDEDNISLLRGSVIGALTCSAMKYLMKGAISKGIIGSVGFSEPVYFPAESVGTRSFYSDFMRTFALVSLMLSQGETLYEAVQEFRELALGYAALYEKEKPEFSEDAVEWMKNNAQFIEFAGDPETRVGARVVL